MRVRKIHIQAGKEMELLGFLDTEIKILYRRDTADTIILMGEEYRFRNNSSQGTAIILCKHPDHVEIDIISSGGSTGLFNFDWGSEKAFIKRTGILIRDFCTENNLWFEEKES